MKRRELKLKRAEETWTWSKQSSVSQKQNSHFNQRRIYKYLLLTWSPIFNLCYLSRWWWISVSSDQRSQASSNRIKRKSIEKYVLMINLTKKASLEGHHWVLMLERLFQNSSDFFICRLLLMKINENCWNWVLSTFSISEGTSVPKTEPVETESLSTNPVGKLLKSIVSNFWLNCFFVYFFIDS